MQEGIIHADCLAAMAALPDRCVDVTLTDPPFSLHVHDHQLRGKDLGFGHLTDEVRTATAGELARVVRRWVAIFSDVEGAHLWRGALEDAGLDYVRTMAWIKPGCSPQFTGDRPAAGYEVIVLAHQPGRKRWNGGGRAGVYEHPAPQQREHPTAKPLALMEALVSDFTDPGELVLDPFAGSGTTGVACKRLGRRFLGYERDPRYHAIATRRIAAAREQLDLLRPRAPKPVQRALIEEGG